MGPVDTPPMSATTHSKLDGFQRRQERGRGVTGSRCMEHAGSDYWDKPRPVN
jgi:hypothetical protein